MISGAEEFSQRATFRAFRFRDKHDITIQLLLFVPLKTRSPLVLIEVHPATRDGDLQSAAVKRGVPHLRQYSSNPCPGISDGVYEYGRVTARLR